MDKEVIVSQAQQIAQAKAHAFGAMRRSSHAVNIGGVIVGGQAPVVVQSMTDTATADVAATVKQILALAQAGSEMVRITVNDVDAARAVPHIIETLRDKYQCMVPIIGDFHYNGHRLLTDPALVSSARMLDK